MSTLMAVIWLVAGVAAWARLTGQEIERDHRLGIRFNYWADPGTYLILALLVMFGPLGFLILLFSNKLVHDEWRW